MRGSPAKRGPSSSEVKRTATGERFHGDGEVREADRRAVSGGLVSGAHAADRVIAAQFERRLPVEPRCLRRQRDIVCHF